MATSLQAAAQIMKIASNKADKRYGIHYMGGSGKRHWYLSHFGTYMTIDNDLKIIHPDGVNCSVEDNEPYKSMYLYATRYIEYKKVADGIFDLIPVKDPAIFNRFLEFKDLWDQDIYDLEQETKSIKSRVSEIYPQFGYVYMLRDLAGNFKIGMTEDLERRMRQHSRNIVNFDVSAAHAFPCANRHQAESAIHRWYEVQMVASETFLLNEAQEQAIRSVQYCDDIRQMLDTLPLPTEELRAQAKELRNK